MSGEPPPPPREPAEPRWPAPPPPPEPRGISGITWLIGVLAVLGIAYVTLNTARTDAPGARGVPVGERLPPFAAPLASSRLEGDANVTPRAEDGGPRPACAVRGPDVVNVCALVEGAPLVLAFVADRPAECLRQLEVLDRVARERPEVAFAAVAIRGERDVLRRELRERRIELPVAHDRDGAVANRYGIGVCPSVLFAERGGVNQATTYGVLERPELERRIARLLR